MVEGFGCWVKGSGRVCKPGFSFGVLDSASAGQALNGLGVWFRAAAGVPQLTFG